MTQVRKSNVMERAKLHFQPMRSTPKKIHIAEWGEGEESIYYSTALNLKERQIIEKMAKDEIEIAVEVIIRKLEDNDGNKIFNRGDKQDLMTKVCPRVVSRVAQEIIGENLEIEDAEKN